MGYYCVDIDAIWAQRELEQAARNLANYQRLMTCKAMTEYKAKVALKKARGE